MPRLSAKVAIVTGGASGIGAETVRRLAAEGAHVLLCDLDEAGAAAICAEVTERGGVAEAAHLDVTSEASWIAVVERCRERFGALHILVNNAGIAQLGPLTDISLDEWHRVMAVNATGVFLGVKHSAAAITEAGGGSIINISSICGKIAIAQSAAYSASKGAVTLLTKVAAMEFANEGRNIRVNSVHPGVIETPLLANSIAAGLLDDTVGAALDRHPIGRLGRPGEIADAVLFLASEESSFMTGSELVVDGGYTAQ